MRTRIKICGITRVEDALEAARLGADAIGLVFYEPSSRFVTTAQAQSIIEALPPLVTTVGLFVDPEPAWVEQVVSRVALDMLQFHGDESPADCALSGKPFIKGVRMRDGIDLVAESGRYANARGLLLDTYQADTAGGSGERFDWERVLPELARSIILAGGLSPDNVAEAIRAVRPYGVDVSSGVEASGGIKDHAKMAAFVDAVSAAGG